MSPIVPASRTEQPPPAPLFGRDLELQALRGLIDSSSLGGVVVMRGHAGVGKSALIESAAAYATESGRLLLRAIGLQSEAQLSYAGLHQLLRPLLKSAGSLAPPQRSALLGAFGLESAAGADMFVIALATLQLLTDVANDTPVAVVVDDAHWLDKPTQDVLAFVARRISCDPVAMITAFRDGHPCSLSSDDLGQLEIGALDDNASLELVRHVAPDAAVGVHERVVREAAGNALALSELPVAFSERFEEHMLSSDLPLTDRLERAFRARLELLPTRTQSVLLVAALNDNDALAGTLDAASALESSDLTTEDLGPAVCAGLADFDQWTIRFRHPLMRAAVAQSVPGERRRAAHRALAQVLSDDPDRQVWHQAAATTRPDEAIASALQDAGSRALEHGAYGTAAAAWERAANLTDDPTRRGSRLLRAAELWVELERPDVADRLLGQTQRLDLLPVERARARWLQGRFDLLRAASQGQIDTLVEIVDELRLGGSTDFALRVLYATAQLFWVTGTDDAARRRVVGALREMPVADDYPLMLSTLAFAAPVDQGANIINRLPGIRVEELQDPDDAYQVGAAALLVGAIAEAAPFIDAAVAGLRSQGRLARLADALQTQAYHGVWSGRWDVAWTSGDEAIRLAGEVGNYAAAAAAQGAQALLAGFRGDQAATDALTDAIEALFIPIGASAMVALAQAARGAAALGRGDAITAAEYLARIYDVTDVAHDAAVAQWLIGDTVEAAVRSDNRRLAEAAMAQVEPVALLTGSPLAAAGLACARPLLASEKTAEPFFLRALAGPLDAFPFMRGRLLLNYGGWLRRQRRRSDSRAPLRTAREVFDAVGAVTWADRARHELRASGEASRRRAPEARDQLSPQELQIAQLAAQGMTNRAIGQRLFVSSRTVGSHLYRIFPKLEITSRSELAGALSSLADVSGKPGSTGYAELEIDMG